MILDPQHQVTARELGTPSTIESELAKLIKFHLLFFLKLKHYPSCLDHCNYSFPAKWKFNEKKKHALSKTVYHKSLLCNSFSFLLRGWKISNKNTFSTQSGRKTEVCSSNRRFLNKHKTVDVDFVDFLLQRWLSYYYCVLILPLLEF